MRASPLPERFEKARAAIEKDARAYGLDFFDTLFYVVDYETMNALVSYSGFPVRYPHWSFGMNHILHKHQRKYGLSKFFELVINTDYANAFLLKNNGDTLQKLVMSHVYAHVDFFKNNMWFSHTNRNMMFDMAKYADIITKYQEKYGEDSVERFLDRVMTLQNLIDPYLPFTAHKPEKFEDRLKNRDNLEERVQKEKVAKYLDKFINTPERMKKKEEDLKKRIARDKKFPRKLEKDVLQFLIDNAKFNNPELKGWQIDILEMLREEMYYFSPQIMTKIMNEGWAVYWHAKLMTEAGHAGDDGIVKFALDHSSVIPFNPRPHTINPYYLGYHLFKYIEEKWDKGRFGLEYKSCDNLRKLSNWDTKTNFGREKIFEVRKFYNDISFIAEFMDQEFCDRHNLFKYGTDPITGDVIVESKDAEDVKKTLIQNIYNMGYPLIYVADGNLDNEGKLLLYHDFSFDEKILDLRKTFLTMYNLRIIWGRDVLLDTQLPDPKNDNQFEPEFTPVRLMASKSGYFVMWLHRFDEKGDMIIERVGRKK